MTLSSRIRAGLMALMIAFPAPAPLPAGAALRVAAPAAMLAAAAAAFGAERAEARARIRSGGYSRPSSGGYSRPSVRTPSFSVPSRPPASSGGYSRPTSPGLSVPRSEPPALGSGDRSVSRRSSGEALDRYRESQRPAPAPAAPNAPTTGRGGASGGSWSWGTGSSGGWDTGWGSRRRGNVGTGSWGGWSGARGWSPPIWATRSAPRFGIWDGLFLWFLLDHLTRPGYADWFHNHQNDPGYAAWRAEAERKAAEDPALRQRLEDLDRRLDDLEGTPRDPDYLPPGTPREVALAEPAAGADTDAATGAGDGWGSVVVVAVLVGGGLLILFVLGRRFRAAARRRGGTGSMGRLDTAAEMLRRKVTGERYSPSLFRVGMTLTLDPTPFVLAGAATKVVPPGGSGGQGLVSVEAVGALTGAGLLHRLYLDGGRGFFQIHLGADGTPDECRWFSVVDEVHPADEAEWGFWIDRAEGMVGWPQFQTKDGRVYDRIWTPGSARVEPVGFQETITDHQGSRTRRLSAMLYAAATGAAAPAPASEYLLATVIEEADSAWVEIAVGIDVNPASLSLA
ncbi:DUF2491 family protein [Arenibaculum pallidiluteum]|uniref:DUF2491 family protein n=1 Tax=Arenibaculum pallidiluteum TaxID=2812559 RepID=UPI001A9772BB|nr:DUF2491 family protein [Arenibaculum pallidiluteum]